METITSWRSATDINSAMSRVYAHMALAVLTSMIVSFLVSTSPALMQFFFTGVIKWLVMFAPLVGIIVLSFGLHKLSYPQAQAALHVFAALMGLSFSTIFIVFTSASIVTAFMAAAVLFAVMSLWGYFTKRNLESMGQFMFIGLIAIVIASIINIFIGSSVAQMVISALAIVVFLGLTAWDTQRIREMVSEVSADGRLEVAGALSLYLNFINIFLNLLQLFGNRE
jgi:FtsH-binding integral membrane protein